MKSYLRERMNQKANDVANWPLHQLERESERLKIERDEALEQIASPPSKADIPAMMEFLLLTHELYAVDHVLQLRHDDPQGQIRFIKMDLPGIA
ncbi:MAG: hypothetical protein OXL40_11615 [Bacteroidota bacterium]|nr:hypothetical protein [Bacteroidota bacterium]